MTSEITVEVWGDLACFSRPESKVERLTYPVPTPSAARGVLSAIYSKPVEFYWQVNRIEILKELQYISFKRNEVKTTAKRSLEPTFVEEERTQRQTVALKDVRYRIAASIVKRPGFAGSEQDLYAQALRRLRAGKCFFQPSLGLREFVCYFEESDGVMPPISLNLDLGYMVYDVFDLHKFAVQSKPTPHVSLFHAKVENGVMLVPPFDSPAVRKPGGDIHA